MHGTNIVSQEYAAVQLSGRILLQKDMRYAEPTSTTTDRFDPSEILVDNRTGKIATHTSGNTLKKWGQSNEESLTQTSVGEIKLFISYLKNSKGPGIDGINNILIMNLPDSALEFLASL